MRPHSPAAHRQIVFTGEAVKRALDVVIASLGLLLLSPLLCLTTLLVLLAHGRPALFRQVRPGLKGQPFTLIKFRTMRAAADRAGRPLPDSRRLTRLGRLLRSTSIDELPELWNVLRGDMSLVGPRPLLMEYLPLYTARQARRMDVKPGVTGLAQVQGRNSISWEEKFRLDVFYVEHWSLRLDLRILMLTIWRVLAREGINEEGSATMENFRGSGPDLFLSEE